MYNEDRQYTEMVLAFVFNLNIKKRVQSSIILKISIFSNRSYTQNFKYLYRCEFKSPIKSMKQGSIFVQLNNIFWQLTK